MFSKKKKTRDPAKKTRAPGNDFGIPGLPTFGVPSDTGADDLDLEAELYALTGALTVDGDSILEDDDSGSDLEAELFKIVGGQHKSSHRQFKKQDSFKQSNMPIQDVIANLESNVEDDEFVDEDDNELMDELLELTEEPNEEEDDTNGGAKRSASKEINILTVLSERLTMYKEAEANAKLNKESARARRFNRGIKTIESQIKEAQAGRPIPPNEIPPVIAKNLKPASEITEQNEPVVPKPMETQPIITSDQSVIPQPMESSPVPSDQPKFRTPEPVKSVNEPNRPTPERVKPAPERSSSKIVISAKNDTIEPSEPIMMGTIQVRPKQEDITPPPLPPKRANIEAKVIPDEDTSNKKTNIQNERLKRLITKRDQYKMLALKAKKEGNLTSALQYMKEYKEIEKEIALFDENKTNNANDNSSAESPALLFCNSGLK